MKARLPVLSLLAVASMTACAQVNSGSNGSGKGGSSATGSGGTTGTGGSSATGAGGSRPPTGSGGSGVAYDAGTCGLQYFDIDLEPPDILVVLDRSETMGRNLADVAITGTEPSKWSLVLEALTAVINGGGADVGWGLKTFPEGDGNQTQCANNTLTPMIDIAVASGTGPRIITAITGNSPVGDGTPTGGAIAVAVDHLKSLSSTRRKFILLATDGQPSCTGRVGSLAYVSGDPSRLDAVAAVTAAATAGYHTFVVGVATTKANDRSTLNSLATAGLEASANPNPLADKFYSGNTREELLASFRAVTDKASACLFPLSGPPPDPELIAVKVGGTKAPRDAARADGWDYVTPDFKTVEVFGSWCNMIKTAGSNRVEIIFGCPGVVIP